MGHAETCHFLPEAFIFCFGWDTLSTKDRTAKTEWISAIENRDDF